MDAEKHMALSSDLITLREYHSRLSSLLERMERLEQSLKTLQHANAYVNAYKDDEESEEDSIGDQQEQQQQSENNTGVELKELQVVEEDDNEKDSTSDKFEEFIEPDSL